MLCCAQGRGRKTKKPGGFRAPGFVVAFWESGLYGPASQPGVREVFVSGRTKCGRCPSLDIESMLDQTQYARPHRPLARGADVGLRVAVFMGSLESYSRDAK